MGDSRLIRVDSRYSQCVVSWRRRVRVAVLHPRGRCASRYGEGRCACSTPTYTYGTSRRPLRCFYYYVFIVNSVSGGVKGDEACHASDRSNGSRFNEDDFSTRIYGNGCYGEDSRYAGGYDGAG